MNTFDAFVDMYRFHLAWGTYLVAGALFCLVCWRVTRGIRQAAWKELIRGTALVMVFTPWYVSDAHEQLAPASVVVAMDLLVGSTENGLAGSLVLLCALALMLLVLLVRLMRRRGAAGQATS